MTSKKQGPSATNAWMISTFIFAGLLFLSLVWTAVFTMIVFSGGLATQAPAQTIPAPSQPTTPPAQQQPSGAAPQIDFATAHTLGDPNAPVVMVEYSSFTCPFCGRFHAETFPDIQSFIDRGDVFYVYRHFPRSAEDVRIANFAECAAEQDAFFSFIDRIYSNQGAVSDANLRAHAQALGLDMSAFDSCVESGRNRGVADDHLAEARQVGVTGTPTFFVNDNRIVGAQPFSVFQQAIQAEI